MEIKYEKLGNLCITDCPFGKRGRYNTIRVGSTSCLLCGNYISKRAEKQIVVCNADQQTNQK